MRETICATCGEVAAHMEMLPPFTRPTPWKEWDRDDRREYWQYRRRWRWSVRYSGPAGSNGLEGDDLWLFQVARWLWAFRRPYRYERFLNLELLDQAGWCPECDAAYCEWHRRRCYENHDRPTARPATE